jgi:glycosyltransferase involved in cell wall biosynthesis
MIHPGIETDIFRPVLSEQKLASRDLYSIPRSKYILLAGCSSLTDINKNIESTLRIASHVNNMLDGNLQLVLFGEGVISAPDDLDVLLLGPIQDRKSLAKVYSMSDAFISTSRLETYGMTLLEAMASGIPVIAYRTGAIPHVLNEGRAGILVDLDDEATMAQSLFDVLTSESIRRSISEYALQLVYNRNSPDTLMKQHIGLYESIFLSAS